MKESEFLRDDDIGDTAPTKSPSTSTPAQSKSTGGVSHSAASKPQARLFTPATRAAKSASAASSSPVSQQRGKNKAPSGSPAATVKERRSQKANPPQEQPPYITLSLFLKQHHSRTIRAASGLYMQNSDFL
jgi:hypothetical protein